MPMQDVAELELVAPQEKGHRVKVVGGEHVGRQGTFLSSAQGEAILELDQIGTKIVRLSLVGRTL